MVDSGKPKHTPGPWEEVLDMDGDHAIWAGDVLVAVTDGWPAATSRVRSRKFRTVEEDAANARLMAAAPDMLEALELAQRWLCNCMPVVELDGPKPLPVIANVLRKAVGDGR